MNNSQIIIRKAEAEDLEAVLRLYNDMHDNPEVPDKERLEQSWNEIITDNRLYLFILESGGIPSATCILDIVPNLTWGARPYGLIENVVTKKEFRRRGFGRKLLEYVLSFAWDADCYKVMLLTGRSDDYILDFYEKAGFKKDIKKGLLAINPDYSGRFPQA